ncbi:phosphatidylinositol 3 [Xylariaceae sp. FL0016]|nr:phosphatidylinositol 3 [Xylariaceae sp. FL0016]
MAPRSGARQLTLKKALEGIESGNRAKGAEGLEDLAQIFKHQSSTPDLSRLDDKSYHRLFEGIFRYAITEKENYYTGKGSKAVATGRLQKCGEALRLSVEHAASRVRRKTMLALVDHITETLPHSDDDMVPPLTQDYIKALVALLGYAPNVELLAGYDGSGWFGCVDFFLQIIAQCCDGVDNDSGFSRASPAPSIGMTMSLAMSTPRSTAGSRRSNNARSPRSYLSDLMQGLHSLVSVPNAPLLKRSHEIATAVTRVLQIHYLGLSGVQQHAFGVLNALLVVTQTDAFSQANSLAMESLPLILFWWQTRSTSRDDALLNGVRTEILKVLYIIHPQLEFLAKQNSEPTLSDDIESLSELLWTEYARRDERAQLQQDDLTYSPGNNSVETLRVDAFALRPFNVEGERQWAVVQNLALLEDLVCRRNQSSQVRSDDDDQPRKKQRTNTGISRLRQRLRSSDRAMQHVALQLIPFLVRNSFVSVYTISELLSFLVVLITSKDNKLSTWAMIACASLAFSSGAGDGTVTAFWRQAWHIAMRSVTMSGTCRAASLLLHSITTRELLPYREIADDVNSIVTTADVNGPAVVVDSSIRLMTALLQLRNYHLPSASHATSNHIVRWVLLRWDPVDASFISSCSAHVAPLDVANLMRATYGDPSVKLSFDFQPTIGPIAEGLSLLEQRKSIVRYLLLLDETPRIDRDIHNKDAFSSVIPLLTDPSSAYATKKLMAELFYPKLEEIGAACNSWANEDDASNQLTPGKLQSAMTCLIVGALVLTQLKEVNTRQSQEMEDIASSVLKRLFDALGISSERQSLTECLIRSVGQYIPTLSSTELSHLSKEQSYLHHLLFEVSFFLARDAVKQSSHHDTDPMDIDEEEFESSGSQSNIISRSAEAPRYESAALTYPGVFYIDATQRLQFIRALHEDTGQVGLVPANFLDDFLKLSDEDFISCRFAVRDVFKSDLIINPDDAARVVERIGAVLSERVFASCEIALNLCIELMEGFITMWSDGDTVLSSDVGDLYHFLQSKFADSLLSPTVQTSFARLLLHLALVDEKFTEKGQMQAPKASLLGILGDSTLPIKFYIGSEIPKLFGRYVLKLHEDVFVEVLDHLPTERDVLEGIALRLFVLAEVSRKWPTLLRRGVYHIFETPGQVPPSKQHAAHCLKKIALTLKLSDTRELFKLFASQLLYTWLEDETVDDISYEIFGFSSLEELLQCAQGEAVAIMEMRGQDDAVLEAASKLGVTAKELIRNNFAKTIAYSMAHDINAKSDQYQSGESRIRKLLGREGFLECVYINFADIIGMFISHTDQEDAIERSWAKDEGYSHAAETMASIKKCGHSTVVLGANMQPSFRGRYLVREIELLTKRTEYETPSLWTPALVVAVARRLFNRIHPALGPLHTCAVIRQVRVLICLAGHHAWQLYPLEMLLHSIRPYLVDTECADDALGMSQFLLENGHEALRQSPSFLAGYALCTLASLKVFLQSSLSSTTQESQFKATMTKAQRFHSWFEKYLQVYKSPLLGTEEQEEAFKAIIQSAAYVRSEGNAERGTHESKLLLAILKDETREVPLLDKSYREMALEMLCRQFTAPDSTSSDVVQSDRDARDLSTAVWKSCRNQKLSEEYMAWAGRVIGRGFAASGHIDGDMLRESGLAKYFLGSTDELESERGLLALLQTLTADSECSKAGLAESALRTIVSDAAAEDETGLLTASQKVLSEQLLETSNWAPYRTPPSDNIIISPVAEEHAFSTENCETSGWAQNLTVYLIQTLPESIMLGALPPILMNVQGFAQEAFPYVLHLVLLAERKLQQTAKRGLSGAMKYWLRLNSPIAKENIKLMINAILYLRTQEMPGENSVADRIHWLDLDLSLAASAATKCGMFKSGLLFVELAASESTRTSRRSSAIRAQESPDILVDIFENIDDPDAYYGLSHTSTLTNVLARLEYEKDGSKSLAFRGAQYDSHIRRGDSGASNDSQSLVATLSGLGLSGLSHALLQNQQSLDVSRATVDSTFSTARKLEIWNLPAPDTTENPSVTIYKAYQAWHQVSSLDIMRASTLDSFSETMRNVVKHDVSPTELRSNLRALASLTELSDTIDISDSADLDRLLKKFTDRSQWMKSGRYDDVGQILSCRETTLSMLSRTSQRDGMDKLSPPEARLGQVRSMILSSGVHRYHQAFQESLNIATSLTDLVSPSVELGLDLDSVARVEVAGSLWDYGEMMSSIRMLQNIDKDTDFKKQQAIPLSRPDLLAKTAYQISVARLEAPDSIQKNYLQPALKELKGKIDGQEAGKVYHQFATFCDEQLQNTSSLKDLARLQNLRQGKNDEVTQLKDLVSGARDTQIKARYQSYLGKAEVWLKLDEQELRRVEQSRSEFVRLSLENYLLSLAASDDHNNDALRFTALWLERSGEDYTNEAVKKHIDKVPTRKFAPLMNQLTSRLLEQKHIFQKLLSDLVYQICVDHPYHGMYQIWSGARVRIKKEDNTAQLRKQATEKVGKRLAQTDSVHGTWAAVNWTSRAYHTLASENGYKGGQKVSMKDSKAASTLATYLVKYKIPPPTMQIELAADLDYSQVPTISKLESTMTIASGVSAPKIITLVGSNGRRFKQLVKGGNDDLRQDAIMEQVFAAVSSVLKLHRSTKQRNLGIRTYKVLPLTQTSGLIEFVPNTIPLHDYLMPAHERYHPKDWKGSQCRKEIHGAQGRSSEARLTTYKKVMDRFQPVMRYFFMEYFVDPDDWFAKRTAYTRTTAAISMLGHVLGLGDRHGHNILLDTQNGEVVHIDLGVAFESGRVLPVPELVPFRLTRDIIDGMGVTRTEGVFRRCCEFTLDALREETYSIMTILDVLRYDPLYSWSLNPVRVAKLQDTRRDVEGDGAAGGAGEMKEEDAEIARRKGERGGGGAGGGVVNEPSEADRALEVVRKKLSKTLSVTATVNDLINQATDERNLAVLYSGELLLRNDLSFLRD